MKQTVVGFRNWQTETSCWGLMSSCKPVERRNKINWAQTETAGGRTGESEHNRRQTRGVKQPSWLNLCLKISHVCELTAGGRCGRTNSCTKQMQKQTNSYRQQGRWSGPRWWTVKDKYCSISNVRAGPGHRRTSTCLQIPSCAADWLTSHWPKTSCLQQGAISASLQINTK